MSLIEMRKIPTTKDNYVGVEIEFLLLGSQQKPLIAKLVKAGLEYNVQVGNDGSVIDTDFVAAYETIQQPWGQERIVMNNHNRMRGLEIRILATEKEIPGIITKTCQIIKSHGGKVNLTCGLHVHLDMRSRDLELVYNNFYFSQKLLFSTQPKQRKTGKYSKILKRKIEKPKTRYYGVNRLSYIEHKTLELRMHEGSIAEKEILVWVGSLIKIANLEKKLSRQLKSFDTLSVPKKVLEYFNERIEKYGTINIKKPTDIASAG